jgi:pyruvate/2-oxoglutarate dehydrogenase complex dihydrolipoamide dehydrogenase (E3) component
VSTDTDVVVVGAGPYGLAVAAHLRFAGIQHRIFGDVMSSWRTQMPHGMVLRSSIRASAIAHPRPGRTLVDWARVVGHDVVAPVPLEDFLDYTDWYAQHNVDPVEPRRVTSISADRGDFALRMSDGERLSARRVVVALGFESCARRPTEFEGIEPELVSHVADNLPLAGFEGRRLIVIGSGQSALESAALAAEAGAQVQIVTRAASVHWLRPLGIPPASRLPHAPTDVGGFTTGWLAATPDAYHVLPSKARARVDRQCLRPAGAHALQGRLAGVPIHVGERVEKAMCQAGEIEVVLSGGDTLVADHVLLGTGYDVDVAQFGIIEPELLTRLARRGRGLRLGAGFESSVPGLFFVGAPAVPSFGPVNRFVTGTWYAAPAVTRRLRGRRGPAWKLAF